ncbi:nickel transporter permease [Geminicoccus roseus]|uniref:nickel transporter permease n=1 Tax=Geminicoccus roseus TaxID=404900 RepID=UPI0004138ACA|nr:nickel transporter permease [Geminicoccus roseus]
MSAVTAWLTTETPASRAQARAGRFYQGSRALLANRLAATGIVIVAVLLVVALLAPQLAPFEPDAQNLSERLLPPSWTHPFGTDQLGRDILSRVIWGSRITLTIIALAAVTVAPIGLTVGIVAGYRGGLVDQVLMRITDVFMAFPRLVLALALVAALGPGIENAIIAIAATAWPPYARLARAETLTLRKQDFIAAAKLQGASHLRILFHHIMPLTVSTILARLTLDLAGMILIAAGLGFLGLGAQPPSPEWGAMVASGREFLTQQWWVATMPGAAIFLVSLAFNLIGDGLRDVLDPKAAGR